MKTLTLSEANQIADKALEKGRELNFAPLTVIVLDAGGHTKVLKREDGCSLLRPEIAMGKAWGTLGMGFGGRDLARRAAKVLAAMGLENALNLDDGGSTALWSGGYKAGPGRNIPNAVLLVRR